MSPTKTSPTIEGKGQTNDQIHCRNQSRRHQADATAAKRQGLLMPNANHNEWDAASKLNCIIATAALNQAELSAYCRENGLFAEQISGWKGQLIEQLSNQTTREDQLAIK